MKKIYISICCLLALGGQIMAQTFTSVDIWPGASSSSPDQMTALNGKTIFQAQDPTTGVELWISDGTPAGTSLLKDIWVGAGSSTPGNFTVIGNKAYFSADDSIHGSELWVTDGTSAGTMMVSDMWAGPGSSSPGFLTAMNGKLYFSASDTIHGDELWVSDGTNAGTSLLKDINPGSGGSGMYGVGDAPGLYHYYYAFTEYAGKLYFKATDGTNGAELWSTDGTSAGTTFIDLWPGPGSGSPYCITVLNGKLIFSASDSLHGSELWTSDGTTGGTSMIKDINPGMVSSSPGDYSAFTLFNGKLYYDAVTVASGDELWVTDGTTSGTTMVKDIRPGPGDSRPAQYGLCVYNNKLYFNANDSVNGYQLWTSDGTSAGTSLLKVLTPYTYRAFPTAFIDYNGQMYFIASEDSINKMQLWTSDGTAGGTHVISPPIAPNTNPTPYSSLYLSNNALYVSADFNSIGQELWIYGFPLGITAVSDDESITVYPNPFSSSVTISGLKNGEQYSVQVLDMTGREFYKADMDAAQSSMAMPDLGSGIYLMTVSGQSSSRTFKLVKQ